MKIAKVSKLNLLDLEDKTKMKNYILGVDTDLQRLILMSQNRTRFGTGSDGADGENLSGQFQLFTSAAGADAEFNVAHTVGAIPIGRLILYQDKAGSLYQGPTTGTNWTATQVSFKCDVASVTFLIFLIK